MAGSVARDLPARASKPGLVVSADDTLREASLAVLRAEGWSAIGASTCDEALRLAGRISLRAVVVDIGPGVDWFACRRLREALHDAPLVVLSATWTPDRWYRGVAQRIGCAGFVVKPCTSRVMMEALHRTCAGEPWVEYVG